MRCPASACLQSQICICFSWQAAGVQVMSNPALTSFKGLDALQQLGGGLLVVNNTALTSLDGLGALGALNATGAASVSLPKVRGMHLHSVC